VQSKEGVGEGVTGAVQEGTQVYATETLRHDGALSDSSKRECNETEEKKKRKEEKGKSPSIDRSYHGPESEYLSYASSAGGPKDRPNNN